MELIQLLLSWITIEGKNDDIIIIDKSIASAENPQPYGCGLV